MRFNGAVTGARLVASLLILALAFEAQGCSWIWDTKVMSLDPHGFYCNSSPAAADATIGSLSILVGAGIAIAGGASGSGCREEGCAFSGIYLGMGLVLTLGPGLLYTIGAIVGWTKYKACRDELERLGRPENATTSMSGPTSKQEVSQPTTETDHGSCAEAGSTYPEREEPSGKPACPEGSEVTGAAPPKGYEQWCMKKDSLGKPIRDGWYRSWFWFCANRIASEGEYREGRRQGKWTYYYPDGEKSLEAEFMNDKKIGLWIFWNQGGTKDSEVEYLDDVEVSHDGK